VIARSTVYVAAVPAELIGTPAEEDFLATADAMPLVREEVVECS
jgi:hypothetical protein